MTSPAEAKPPATTGPALSFFALIVWLLIQLLALSFAALRVPLWARSAAPGDALAIDVMLITQIGAAALLFPALLVNCRTTATLVLVSIPFVEMAGLLAGVLRWRMTLASVLVVAWLVALWLCVPLLRRSRAGPLIGVAIAASITLGGPLLLYLQLESSPEAVFQWNSASLFGPAMGALALIHSPTLLHRVWLPISAGILTGIILRVIHFAKTVRRNAPAV